MAFSRNVFIQDDFMPAKVTNQPEENSIVDAMYKDNDKDNNQDHELD